MLILLRIRMQGIMGQNEFGIQSWLGNNRQLLFRIWTFLELDNPVRLVLIYLTYL